MAKQTRHPAAHAGSLRHPAEVPFFAFMAILNLIIITVILQAAALLPFLPDKVRDSGWGTAIRAALIGLLLLVPVLIVVRETQRASPAAGPR